MYEIITIDSLVISLGYMSIDTCSCWVTVGPEPAFTDALDIVLSTSR